MTTPVSVLGSEDSERLPEFGSGRHPQRWFIFIIVATGMLMGNLNQTVVATALPNLRASLHVTINWIAWTFTIYQLGMVVALPVAGRLSDQFGRKRLFLGCVALFTLASLACGLSSNIAMLIVCRAIQAVGAGGLMPSATGIIADHFGEDRDRGVGMIASIAPAGALLGPVLGALVINYWSWRGVFLINIPIAVIVLVLGVIVIPQSPPRGAARADYPGIALLALSILPMMYGITTLGSGKVSLDAPQFLVPELVAIVFLVLLIRHTQQSPDPILPLRLLRIPSFAAMNVINTIYGGCVLGIGALVPLYVEDHFGFSPFQAGTVLTARSLGVIVSSAAASLLIRRTGYRKPMLLGFGLAAISMYLIGTDIHYPTVYLWLAGTALLMGIGAGIAIPATNNALLAFSAPDVAAISGIRGMFKQLGAIITISIASAFAARSPHPGVELAHSFVIFSLLVVGTVMPLVFTVPERRERW